LQQIQTKSVITEFLDRLDGSKMSALLLDYDGTLAPFHTDRFKAVPYAGVLPLLEEILRSGKTRIVVITGRPIREVQALLSPLSNLEIWGAHGLEHAMSDGTYRQIAIDPKSAEALAAAEQWLRAAGFISLAEIKPGGIAVHLRGLPDKESISVREHLEKGWTAFADQPELKLLQFDGGLELRVTRPDKGDAMAAILRTLGPDAPAAFLGDDLTDEDAFSVLEDRGLPILVRPEYRETRAKAWIKPPHELIEFFEQWLSRVSA